MRAALLSLERWDQVWRRNQQLASRVPRTLFVEPARRGFRSGHRQEHGVDVLTPPKPLPRRWTAGRSVDAWIAARWIRSLTGTAELVTWATHALDAPLARALRCPVVYDRTDDWPAMEQEPRSRVLVAQLDRELIKRADAVVIVSEEMRAQTRPDAELIPNGVDVGAFRLVTRTPSREGPLRVAYTGTVDPYRIDMGILRALTDDPAVHLIIAGPGDRVPGSEHHGVVAHEQLPKLLAGCDALVAPYRMDCEVNRTGDSLKLYEYFATGLPVIATLTAGFQRYPELVAFWSPQLDIRGAAERQRDNALMRRSVAESADWSARAGAMQRVLERVSAAR